MPQSTPVRTAVVGLGRFGRLHSLTLAGLAEAELVGVVARREESLQAVADDEAAALWAGKVAQACGWPQEVRRFKQ